MLFKALLAACLLYIVAAEPQCSWTLPANLSACNQTCWPTCTFNETVTCVNSTCSQVPHCTANCTGAVYSNVSCPDCTPLCTSVDCPVDCTVNPGKDCAWVCETNSDCVFPTPILDCEPYYCPSNAFSMSLHGLLLGLLFS